MRAWPDASRGRGMLSHSQSGIPDFRARSRLAAVLRPSPATASDDEKVYGCRRQNINPDLLPSHRRCSRGIRVPFVRHDLYPCIGLEPLFQYIIWPDARNLP